MYLVALDTEMKRTSNGNRGLDEVILELLARKNGGQAYSVNVFLSLVPGEREFIIERYREMASGRHLQVPPTDSMSDDGLTLQCVDMPPFELGDKQFRDGDISNITEGSRAAEAGLQGGDSIVETSDVNWAAARLERNVTVRVRRSSGEVEDVAYWPRAKYSVEGYQWI